MLCVHIFTTKNDCRVRGEDGGIKEAIVRSCFWVFCTICPDKLFMDFGQLAALTENIKYMLKK